MELDTFLAIPDGTKNIVWVNGFNLGRYWISRPQQSLYLPGTVLKPGGEMNEVVVLKLEPDSSKEPIIGRGSAIRECAIYADPDAP